MILLLNMPSWSLKIKFVVRLKYNNPIWYNLGIIQRSIEKEFQCRGDSNDSNIRRFESTETQGSTTKI